MYYVGIDIAKLNHFASVVSSDGEVLVKPFKFTNDNDGFCTLLSALASYDRGSLIIGLESTAHYADNLVEFLVSKRYQVCVINPIQTSTMRKNNIRKTKTDKVDTLVIARTLIAQPHRFFSQEDIDLMHLKNLGRFRQKNIKERTPAKNTAHSLRGPCLSGTPVLLQIRTSSEDHLRSSERGSYT